MTDTPTPPDPKPAPPVSLDPPLDSTKFDASFLQDIWSLLPLEVDVRFELRQITLVLPSGADSNTRETAYSVKNKWSNAGLPVKMGRISSPIPLQWGELLAARVGETFRFDVIADAASASRLTELGKRADKISISVFEEDIALDELDVEEQGE